jgi:hypothetical protein
LLYFGVFVRFSLRRFGRRVLYLVRRRVLYLVRLPVIPNSSVRFQHFSRGKLPAVLPVLALRNPVPVQCWPPVAPHRRSQCFAWRRVPLPPLVPVARLALLPSALPSAAQLGPSAMQHLSSSDPSADPSVALFRSRVWNPAPLPLQCQHGPEVSRLVLVLAPRQVQPQLDPETAPSSSPSASRCGPLVTEQLAQCCSVSAPSGSSGFPAPPRVLSPAVEGEDAPMPSSSPV